MVWGWTGVGSQKLVQMYHHMVFGNYQYLVLGLIEHYHVQNEMVCLVHAAGAVVVLQISLMVWDFA